MLRQLRSISPGVRLTSRLSLHWYWAGSITLIGIPAYHLHRLQSVMNAAARSITGLQRSVHITDTLASLYLLRSSERIQYKLAMTVFRPLHGLAPPYLSDDLHHLVDVPSWRCRCSSTCRALIVGLLATERSLLPVWRSGTVCHTTLLTVCHWRHSAGSWTLFCFLYHFHDYILVVLEFFTQATLKILYACMYVCIVAL